MSAENQVSCPPGTRVDAHMTSMRLEGHRINSTELNLPKDNSRQANLEAASCSYKRVAWLMCVAFLSIAILNCQILQKPQPCSVKRYAILYMVFGKTQRYIDTSDWQRILLFRQSQIDHAIERHPFHSTIIQCNLTKVSCGTGQK